MATRRRCPTCGSKQWHKEPSSGLIACSEGHVLQNYRNEATDAVEGMGQHALRKRALKSGKKKKEGGSRANPKLYYGARGRQHYFECQQLLLRKQVAALTGLWCLPPEFEIICRDVWALHLSLLPNTPLAEPLHYDQDFTQDIRGGKNSTPNTEKDDTVTSGSRTSRSPEPLGKKYDDSEGGESSEDEGENGPREDVEGDGGEDDPELAALLRMNSDISSSSDSEDEQDGEPRQESDEGKVKTKAKGRRQKGRAIYESPASTIAVLIVACWTMRIPVMYRDFTRLIELYELPYLDSVSRGLLPASMVAHLTKHNIQALSPYYAPSTMALHGLASRLSKRMYTTYGIFTPEANAAPILWRVISQALGSTPTLYTLTKRLSHILSLPLTLHHILAPGLERRKTRDSSKHNYDNAPPEVSFVGAAIVVLKMVYGLDGRPRLPIEPNDPACALPRIDEYLRLVGKLNDADSKQPVELFSSRGSMCAGDLNEAMTDEYLEFCEQALLPANDDGGTEDSLLARYFPLPERSEDLAEGDGEREGETPEGESDRHPAPTTVAEGENILRPGEGYQMFNSRDTFGTLPCDYELIMERGARWVGVSVDKLSGVVETYERRLQRWWELEKRRARDREGRLEDDD